MNDSPNLIREFEKKIEDNRRDIEARRAEFVAANRRSLSKNRSRWLRETVLRDAQRRIAV